MSQIVQIIILMFILILLILYFVDIVGSDQYNFQVQENSNEHERKNIKDIQNLSDQDYISGMLKNIKNFDKEKFKTVSCKALTILFAFIRNKEFDKLKELVTNEMFNDLKIDYSQSNNTTKSHNKSNTDNNIKILLINNNRSRNKILNDLIFHGKLQNENNNNKKINNSQSEKIAKNTTQNENNKKPLEITFIKYVDVEFKRKKQSLETIDENIDEVVNIYIQYTINNQYFIFEFVRLSTDNNIWLWKSVK